MERFEVCFVGNRGNWSYRHARSMRAAGVGCRLVCFPERESKRGDPALIDPEIAAELDGRSLDWLVAPQLPLKENFFREVEEHFDLVVASGQPGITFASRFDTQKIPLVVHTTGPMNIPEPEENTGRARKSLQTLRMASMIMTAHPQTMHAVTRLGLADKLRFQLPLLDVTLAKQTMDSELHRELRERYGNFDTLFCWFSRNVLDAEDPCYKGTEIFIAALKKFFDGRQDANIRVVFGNHGPDAEQALSMIAELGLSERVDIVDHLSFPELTAYLSLPNLVLFDNLAQGTISSGMLRDTLSLGAILVRRIVEKDLEIALGPDCPIINAWDVDSTESAMVRLAGMAPARIHALQEATYQWCIRHMHEDARVGSFIDTLREPVMRFRTQMLAKQLN